MQNTYKYNSNTLSYKKKNNKNTKNKSNINNNTKKYLFT